MMTKLCGNHNHNLLVLLLASLLFVSMIVNSQCRPLITSKLVDEEEKKEGDGDDDDDLNLGMKWELETMSRDEIVQVAGYGEDKLSTVLLTGTLTVCDKSCLAAKPHHHHQSLLPAQPISGALVGVICHNNGKDSLARTVTDKYGDFIIDLPSHLHSISNLDKVCSITILELPKDTPCHQSDVVGECKEIELASVGNGIRTYTTGRIVLQHTAVPKISEACIMKRVKADQ